MNKLNLIKNAMAIMSAVAINGIPSIEYLEKEFALNTEQAFDLYISMLNMMGKIIDAYNNI